VIVCVYPFLGQPVGEFCLLALSAVLLVQVGLALGYLMSRFLRHRG